MNEKSCRVCGCTDRFGCEERCHWADGSASVWRLLDPTAPICSICAGVTPKRKRSYTRTAAAAGRPDVPAGMLAIYNPVGRLVGLAWHISEAQAMARGIDAYYLALRRRVDKAHGRKPWRRGPIARFPSEGHFVGLEGDNP